MVQQEQSPGDEQLQIEYFQKHVVPWLIGHLTMRSTGLQIFTAIQGGLIVAWATRPYWALPLLGLTGCLSFIMWDRRNRFIFSKLHELGEQTVDRKVFGVAADGRARAGLHRMSVDALSRSGRLLPSASHTWAIRTIVIVSVVLWMSLIVSAFVPA